MDSAQNRFIELRYPVCGQEQYSLVVFQFAEEHRDKAVASQIIERAPLKKDIRFVQKKNCVPMAGGLEDSRESVFEFCCIAK